jgi:N-acetylmuramoyl-L-alanine amidase
MMKFRIFIISILWLFSPVYAEIRVNVIYPNADQQLPFADSTFIFGNVTPGAKLSINGIETKVHKGGGWLAFVPVEAGQFRFEIMATTENDTSVFVLPVQVGPAELIDPGNRPVIPNSADPNTEVTYSAGDVFKFSFKAPAGGTGYYKIGDSDSVVMNEIDHPELSPLSSVFGDVSSSENVFSNYVTYSGYYRLKEKDIGKGKIEYWFRPYGSSLVNAQGIRRRSTGEILNVMPEFPPVIGELSGESQIIRTGVRRGYKLLYMPAGIKVHITGMERDFYKLRLGKGITGYTNVDSVIILPQGTEIPSGRVAYITVSENDDYAELSCAVGENLPYEVTESPASNSIDIDIFGVTGDVDWIRYITETDMVKIVKWSQPNDDIFRITLELNEGPGAGYRAFYEDNTFVFRIKKNPKLRRWPNKPFWGVTVAIDPGHSHDSGAIGPTGLKEKDANLWIAHELRQMLLDEGAYVIMTRYGHEHIPLYDRPKMAVRRNADILISIHNNALPDGINPFENNGVSVYYYHPHSKPLAEAIHKRMVKKTRLPDHGLYYGNLVLTRPPELPAVLVECAFMMIPEQEAMLKTDDFQRKCADAIMEGIKDYLKLFR